MRQYMIFNWVAMITYSVKLLTLDKATRAPYKRAPASAYIFAVDQAINNSLVVFSC